MHVALARKMIRFGVDDAKKNVLGKSLKLCSQPGEALTGFERTGRCVINNSDAGKHTVCMKMTDDFCKDTGQSDWCKKRQPCNDVDDNKCEVKHWCVCQEAFANYVDRHPTVEIKCDATALSALEHYEAHLEVDKYKKAAEIILNKCSS